MNRFLQLISKYMRISAGNACIFSLTLVVSINILGMGPVLAADAEAYFEKAQLAHRKGNIGAAERYYYRALRSDPSMTKVAYTLIDLNYVQEKLDVALDVLDKALQHNNDDGQLWARKGMIHDKLGEITKAQIAYNKAVAMSPEDDDVLTRAAGFYMSIGNRAKAEEMSEARRALAASTPQ